MKNDPMFAVWQELADSVVDDARDNCAAGFANYMCPVVSRDTKPEEEQS